ncbi:MAG: serine/threonine protein kinase [Clostridiales bacterium]|nr:serine/threonine protein kinase [Clostridiales bacterium]
MELLKEENYYPKEVKDRVEWILTDQRRKYQYLFSKSKQSAGEREDMTLQEESRLSYYKKIAEISTHKNVVLVQHIETKKIYVRKDLTVYDRDIYLDLMVYTSQFFPGIYECIESEGTLILVEEYIQGQNLEEYLEEKGTLAEAEVRLLVSDICEALKDLHNRPVPVIHRDLKPSNILLTADHQIKIVDFNIARNYESGQGSDTVIMGTRKYAAPEQYGYAQTDARTDLYALGVMMNYLLTGKYPSDEIFFGEMEPIIRKCIQFDPDQRYQSAAELQRDLMIGEGARQANMGDAGHGGRIGTRQQRYADEVAIGEAKEGSRMGRPSASGTKTDVQGREKKHPLLPPGFRTGTAWKALLAVIGYATLWFFGLTLTVDDGNGMPETGLLLCANRTYFISIGMLCIFFWFNYMDVHRYLPLMKKRGWKIIGYVLYTVLITVAILVILTCIENR